MLLIDGSRPHYRANLHTHTTMSDGQRTPSECIALYRSEGYDILAITDHRRVTVPEDVPEGLLTVPGIELDYLLPGQAVHLLGLGVSPEVAERWDRKGRPQQGVEDILACGGLCVLAHPAWSMNDPAMMASLRGVSAVEIWNSVSDVPYNAARADSSSLLDTLWSNHPDTLLPVLASDDTHFYGSEFARGWSMVEAESLTVPAVLEAIRLGRVYATQGPVFERLELTEEGLLVRCSPCDTVIFYSNAPWVAGRSRCGQGQTEALYRPAANDRFVRVQLIDEKGRSAWSMPVDLRQ